MMGQNPSIHRSGARSRKTENHKGIMIHYNLRALICKLLSLNTRRIMSRVCLIISTANHLKRTLSYFQFVSFSSFFHSCSNLVTTSSLLSSGFRSHRSSKVRLRRYPVTNILQTQQWHVTAGIVICLSLATL